jgi:hypothetical protein
MSAPSGFFLPPLLRFPLLQTLLGVPGLALKSLEVVFWS